MRKHHTAATSILSLAGVLAGAGLCWAGCMSSTNETICSPDCTYSCGPSWFSSPGAGFEIPGNQVLTVTRCRTYSTGALYDCGPGSPPMPPNTVATGCSGPTSGTCCGHLTSDAGAPDDLGLQAQIPAPGGDLPCTPPSGG